MDLLDAIAETKDIVKTSVGLTHTATGAIMIAPVADKSVR